MSECVLKGIAGGAIGANLFCYKDESDSGKIKLETSDTALETVGVTCRAATSGDPIDYYSGGGFAWVYAGGAINPGDIITNNSDGKAVAAGSSKAKRGRYMPTVEGDSSPTESAAADGDLILVKLFDDMTNLTA